MKRKIKRIKDADYSASFIPTLFTLFIQKRLFLVELYIIYHDFRNKCLRYRKLIMNDL